jgi:CRP-like cAMP-binding protein
MIDQDASLLADSRLFGYLPLADRQKIAHLCTRKNYRARQVVFHQGELGREMFIVASGQLKVSVISEEGKELSFFIFHKNDIFGELALLDGERRSATVTTIGPCELLVLHQNDFKQLIKEHQSIGLQLLSILAGRIRSTTSLYESSVFVEIPGRLASKLLELGEEDGTSTEEGILIDLKLSQYELGTLVNASRESVNKLLKTWEGQGIIKMQSGKILLLDLPVLKALL